MRSPSGAALIAVTLSVGVAHAAAEPSAQRFSLQEAEARAAAKSPVVRLAQKERNVVAASRVGAGVRLPSNPYFVVGAGDRQDHSGSVPPADGPEWQVRADQTLEIGNQRGTRLREADKHLQAADARLRLAEVETRARVRAAYVGLLLAQSQARFAREREALGMRVLDSARARVKAGAASDVELHLAESEAGRVTHERISADLNIELAAGELRRLLDLPAESPFELTTPLGAPTLAITSANLEQAIAAAEARRNEIKALEASKLAVDASIVRLRRDLVPSPTLFVEVQSQQPGQLYVGGGIGFALPIFRRNQGEIAIARAEIDRLEEQRRVTGHEIALEVARLFHAARAHREQSKLWTDQIVPASIANLELVRQGWTAGKFDIFRLVQVAREADAARRTELETLGALWSAAIELDRATGGL